MDKTINNFELLIHTDANVIKISNSLKKILRTNIKKIIHLSDIFDNKNDLPHILNLVKEVVETTKDISENITLTLNNKNISYRIYLKPIKKNESINSIRLVFVRNRDISHELRNICKILKERNFKNIKSIAKETCKLISKDLALTNLFLFNNQNSYQIRYWDISSEIISHFMSKSDKSIIDYIKKHFIYHFLSIIEIDNFIDYIFSQNKPVTLSEINFDELNLTKIKRSIPPDVVDIFFSYLKKNNFVNIVCVPIQINNIRVGIIVLFKDLEYSELEIRAINEIHSLSIAQIEKSSFYRQYKLEYEDINNIKIKFPDELYKILYDGLINLNNINNIFELKTFCAKELKKLTFSDYTTYYEIKNDNLIPVYSDESTDIKEYLKKNKLSFSNPMITKTLRIKNILFYNSEKNSDYKLYDLDNDELSFLFCPLLFSQDNSAGIFILTKSNFKHYNVVESTIASTFLKHTITKYKELIQIKINTDSKTKYKALYETILSLNTSNSFFTTLDIIAKVTGSLVSTETVVIYKISDDKNYLSAIYSNEKVDIRINTYNEKIPIDKYLVGKSCTEKKTNFMNIENYDPNLDSCSDKMPKSMMCIPLLIKDELLGVMVLARYNHINFNNTDFETILPFAQQSINIVYQNLLLQKNNETKEVYKALFDTISFLNVSKNINSIFKNISEKCIKLTHSSKAIFMCINQDQSKLKILSYINKNNVKTNFDNMLLDIKDNVILDSINSMSPIISNYNSPINRNLSMFEESLLELEKYSAIFYPIEDDKDIKFLLILERGNLEKFYINDISKLSLFFDSLKETLFNGHIGKSLKIKNFVKEMI